MAGVLMTTWGRFRVLDAADRWLAVEAGVLMVSIQIGFRTLPYAVLRAVLGRLKRVRCASDPYPRIARAVNAVGRRLPGRTCLSEALTADVMLCRRGHPSAVRLGVRKSPGSAGTLETHAWVECGGEIVTGRLATLDEYKILQ
jgi:Transglutaminase-like superfamily